MFQRWLSPRTEARDTGSMVSKFRTTTFDNVVDAQSQHYAVACVVLFGTMKKVQTFHKLVACVMDSNRNPMYCEAIGSEPEIESLQKLYFVIGKPLLVSALCYKRSTWHAGGKYLDLTKKQKVRVEALPPTHESFATLQKISKDGPLTLGDIAGLRGLEQGHKANLTGVAVSCHTKILKDGQAGMTKEIFLEL